MTFQNEKDTIGEVRVPEKAYYGAQTARSLNYFNIGSDTMPKELIKAYAILKIATAKANVASNKLTQEHGNLIIEAANEIISGKLDNEFPLSVWQTGSGTQTNMNVNEVIANRANQIFNGQLGTKQPITPNDHVNLSQSSNDSFPTAMHLCAYDLVSHRLIPSINNLIQHLKHQAKNFENIIKIGRTHLQDATPLTLKQEFDGFVSLLERCEIRIIKAMDGIMELAIGGTAVGTGINAPKNFSDLVCKFINEQLKTKFRPHPNKFAALSAHDEIVHLAGTLDTLAGSLMKIANDIRWLSSGPRCGLGELSLPENEPGSSIMPGKVNPTQCEALTMVAVQVKGYVNAISIAGSQGNFQLNVFKPMMIFNISQAIYILSDSMNSFAEHCIKGITPNAEKIDHLMKQSLMLVTALTQKLDTIRQPKSHKMH